MLEIRREFGFCLRREEAGEQCAGDCGMLCVAADDDGELSAERLRVRGAFAGNHEVGIGQLPVQPGQFAEQFSARDRAAIGEELSEEEADSAGGTVSGVVSVTSGVIRSQLKEVADSWGMDCFAVVVT